MTAAVKPTTARKTPAKKGVGGAANTPAKKGVTGAGNTPAKAPVKPAPTPAARKLRWQVEGGDRSMAGKVNQTAAVEGYEYRIAGADKVWTASVEHDGKTTVLVADGSFAAAYRACVEHNRAR